MGGLKRTTQRAPSQLLIPDWQAKARRSVSALLNSQVFLAYLERKQCFVTRDRASCGVAQIGLIIFRGPATRMVCRTNRTKTKLHMINHHDSENSDCQIKAKTCFKADCSKLTLSGTNLVSTLPTPLHTGSEMYFWKGRFGSGSHSNAPA